MMSQHTAPRTSTPPRTPKTAMLVSVPEARPLEGADVWVMDTAASAALLVVELTGAVLVLVISVEGMGELVLSTLLLIVAGSVAVNAAVGGTSIALTSWDDVVCS